ncbi:MAG TPA: hypothetical protein VMW69_10445 [Spirochaetia bacterium]|nr:hypothetical protein [Spirochaetia bacterium]
MVLMDREPSRAEDSLAGLLPPIRRARGFHLYDHHGKRYLDLHLSGGRSLLGHRPEKVLLELKNLASRGLLGDLPSVYEARLHKALLALIPDHPVVRVFANEERLIAALRGVLPGMPPAVDDPILRLGEGWGDPDSATLRRWRPLAPVTDGISGVSVLVPVLPFPASFAPSVACFRNLPEDAAPKSDPVSPALLGALTKALYELRSLEGRYHEERGAPFDAPWWQRIGPYLVAKCEKGEYSELFRRLLEKGIYINPEFPGPSIVPLEYSEGETRPLRELARVWAAERGEGER